MTRSVVAGRRDISGRSIRWNEERAGEAYAQGDWVRETLAEALARAATDEPDHILIVDGQVRIGAASLYARAARLAQALAARYPTGSVVSFMLPNWHEAAVIYMAVTLAGMIAHPVLPSLREHELRFMLSDVNSRIVFIPREFRSYRYAAMLQRVVAALDAPPQVVVVRDDGNTSGSQISFDALFDDAPSDQQLRPPDADAVRMIMYTSGTTGRPKGVMHSHNSMHALIRQIGRHWLVDRGDTFLVAGPVSHIGGSIYAFECPLLLGTTAVLMEQWNADRAVQQLVAERCTHFAGATPFLVQTLAAARKAGTRLPDLKLFVCGGASVPPSLIHEAADYFQHAAVTRVYGSTEVPVTTVGVTERRNVRHAAETDGRPGIADVRLTDASGSIADAGEVVARGPQMLVGYVHPGDEEAAFDDEGYYRTGDLGRWVDGDYLVIDGRIKDIIIRNGENIAPKEVEDLLAMHPDIAEVAIVGLPDPATGERACAVIVPSGTTQPDVASLYAFLDDRGVAKFKIPEQVEIRDMLPKNDAGKVLKHEIRMDLAGRQNDD